MNIKGASAENYIQKIESRVQTKKRNQGCNQNLGAKWCNQD